MLCQQKPEIGRGSNRMLSLRQDPISRASGSAPGRPDTGGLAARANVTQSVISAYESDRRQPTLPTLASLVQAAGFELSIGLRRRRT